MSSTASRVAQPTGAGTRERQERALEILQFKLDVLWSMLDAIEQPTPTTCRTRTAMMRGPQTRRPRLDASVSPMFRLQFEPAQDGWVLLYPEGMVRLNEPAAEILRRCDGQPRLGGELDRGP